MRYLDLFSGIGGFAYAFKKVFPKGEIVTFCEIEKYAQYVLMKNFPGIPIHDDIKTLRGDKYGPIDILVGGDPCQPNSVAGNRKGESDDRFLWPEKYRIVKESRPNWIINENVVGSISNMVLDSKITDLESEGYTTQAFIIPANAVGAPHRRDRVWLIANNTNSRIENLYQWEEEILRSEINTDSRTIELQRGSKKSISRFEDISIELERVGEDFGNRFNLTESPLCGADDGVSFELDGYKWSRSKHRRERIKGLGNAIVSQIAMVFFQVIKKIEELEIK